MVFWIVLTPAWRGFHFYFAHRFIHLRFMYKYIHSLHHRNTDIEPFSGLCMHLIEHLYYFSCVLPSLVFHMSPLHFLWNGMHLLLSPAASHSGWEDHVQSDQFHYLHHNKFECNYGSASVPMDSIFGTFRDRMGDVSPTYKGAGDEKLSRGAGDEKAATAKPAASMVGFKTASPPGFGLYMLFSAAVFAVGVAGAAGVPPFCDSPYLTAAFVAYGPLAFALLLMASSGDASSMHKPFHKEALFGSFGLHYVVGFLVGVYPVYRTLAMLYVGQ